MFVQVTVLLVSYSYCIPVLVNETSQDYLNKPETDSLPPLRLDNQTKPETGSLPSLSLGPGSTLYNTAVIETSLEPPRMYRLGIFV